MASTFDTHSADGTRGVAEWVTRLGPRPRAVQSARHRGRINHARSGQSESAPTNYLVAPDATVAVDTAPHMNGERFVLADDEEPMTLVEFISAG